MTILATIKSNFFKTFNVRLHSSETNAQGQKEPTISRACPLQ